MKILIDRDELVRVFNNRRALYCDEKPESFRRLDYSDKCRVDMLDSCIADAFNMPTYEAVYNKKSLSEELENQKTGHWIEQGLSPYEGIRRCSVCYKTYDIRAKFNYCPNCGAKMEGEEDA